MMGGWERFRAARWPALAALLAFTLGIAVGKSFQRAPVPPVAVRAGDAAPSATPVHQASKSAGAGEVETDDALVEMDNAQKMPPVRTEELRQRIQAALAGGKLNPTLFGTISRSVTKENAAELTAFVETLPRRPTTDTIRQLLVSRWADLDPTAAVSYVQTLPDRK